MNSEQLTKLANALDALADQIDAQENEKRAAEEAARAHTLAKFAERYELRTGEELPVEIREKMASMETEALEHVLKVASAETTDVPMGGPAETMNKTASSERDALVAFCMDL